ncbi:MAG: hypothetical protein IKX17_06505 [Prevotella sp.]|nr:hypothetical protein [Prevotella sp.]
MKRFLILLSLFAAVIFPASADEYVSVENLSIPQGKQAEMVVYFNFNENHEYVSYQFTIELPEGVSLVADEYGKVAVTLADNQPAALYTASLVASTGIVSVYSDPSTPIAGSSGTLVRIPVEASAALEVGTNLTGRLKTVEFTKNTGSVRTPFADATINITIAEPRLVFDENSTFMPTFTAGAKENVKMNRTIKANQWSTIVLPFTLTKAKAEAAFGSDVQLAEFSGFTVDYGDDEENVTPLGIALNFSTYTMSAKKPMTGGKTFLIKTSSDITSFEADDCTLVATVTDTEKTDEYDTAGKFTGSLVKTKVPADGLFIAENKFWYSTGATNIKAFRGWFELGAVLDKETDFGAKVAIFIDDIPTSIDGLSAVRQQGDVYTISGLYVGRNIPTERLKKGIYIVNGKKVVIK